ncbi:MAG: DUF1203 domain-containing protein [Nitratireductor sp.]|nr:DUF1203 domain-containing protein [Nitratireductor sp.]
MTIKFVAIDTPTVRRLQTGSTDAYGNTPVRRLSDGKGVPCRHCLKPVRAGEAYLTLSYSPFSEAQPYAETGPIFLHADPCERAEEDAAMPAMFHASNHAYILRGYDGRDWITYDVAEVVAPDMLEERAAAMLGRADVAYLHMRSSRFNCYQCRIERGSS